MIYIGCAAAGLFALALQIVLSALGVGDHDGAADAHAGLHDAEHSGGYGMLSLRALAAFLAFFGLTGWWMTATGASPVVSAAASLAAGVVVMFAVGWLARQQRRLDTEGNLDPQNAVGQTASVYLRVPARGQGHGKVHVKVQGRTAELAAASDGGELPTGTVVKIVRLVTADTVVVAPLDVAPGER
jgi:hypothetical protein